jgi:hypothetical protein
MSENRFFQNIQSTLADYTPEVPRTAYAGMRRKLWWSNFTIISATRFNVWYALLIVSSASLLYKYSSDKSTSATEVVKSETIQTQDQNPTVPSTQQEQQILRHQDEVLPVTAVKPSTESPSAPVLNSPELLINEPVVSENSTVETSKEGIEHAQQKTEKVDTIATVAKGTKKGLKVKTFQVSDK